MEMNIIHNEVKANSVLESQFSNTFTNQKKQTICLDIIEKVNAVGNTQRTIEGKMKNYVQGCHAKICRGSERSKGTRRGRGRGGAPPLPLSQCVTDIVKMYKDCSSFWEYPVDDSQERFNSAYGQTKSQIKRALGVSKEGSMFYTQKYLSFELYI